MLSNLVAPVVASSSAEAARASAATAKELLEEIAETRTVKMKLGTVLETAVESALRLRRAFGMVPILAQFVVLAPFDRVAQDFVGFVDLLELFLGGGFVLGDVGMIFAGERAEGLFDFGVGGVSRHAEHGVVVLEFNGHGSTLARCGDESSVANGQRKRSVVVPSRRLVKSMGSPTETS